MDFIALQETSGMTSPGILAVMRDGVDAEYLRNWAERLGVDDLLHKALDEVESQG